jgi:uncharacterized protein (TIGR04255 family)
VVPEVPVRRRVYREPPVHEVVLDLQFAGETSIERLGSLPEQVGDTLGIANPVTRISAHTLASPRGVANRPPEQQFWGWEFVREDPIRVVTVSANQVAQHFLRSQGWPTDSYVGWEANASAFLDLLRVTGPFFKDLEVRRAGLRYINRIAIPSSSTLEEWFTVVPPPLTAVDGLWGFSISRTWERAPSHPGLSATVTLAKADIPPTVLPHPDDTGIVLDIDVFNLWVHDAPHLDEVPQWIQQAHSLENTIFESCITESLAARFKPTEG